MYTLCAYHEPDIENIKLHAIRNFTSAEADEYFRKKADHAKISQKFGLLFIHENNFRDFKKKSEELFQNATKKEFNIYELHRVFMNYLSSGYAMREHLNTAIKRDFGRSSEVITKFNELIKNLEKESKSFAFFQDFRNYVQHCGFPIGNASVNIDESGTTISITHNRDDLLREYRDWNKSSLATWKQDEIDLTALTFDYHSLVKILFPAFIQEIYGATLFENDAYFLSMQEEARQIDPTAVAVVMTDKDFSSEKMTFTLDHMPESVFRDLGLVLPPRTA